MNIGIGVGETGGSGLPDKFALSTKILREFKIDFCLIIADFCRVFQPPVSYAYADESGPNMVCYCQKSR